MVRQEPLRWGQKGAIGGRCEAHLVVILGTAEVDDLDPLAVDDREGRSL